MPRIREIKKHGNSFVIKLSIYDMQDFELEEGDKIDIETSLLTGKVKKRKKLK